MKRTILAVGDIIGQAGMRCLFSLLPGIKKQYHVDLTIANGENVCDGFGITPELAKIMFKAGVDVITTGNHIWDHKEILPYLDDQPNILRPANYPPGLPGRGSTVIANDGISYAVINLQGRERMVNIDCPFRKGAELLRKCASQADVFIIDFHADAPQEKEALAYYFAKEATLLFGTHTHIQTADERILSDGLAYISDIGSTGPANSIIGFDGTIGIQRCLSDIPLKNEVSTNPPFLQGIVVEFDDKRPLIATEIQRINIPMRLLA